MSRAARQRWIEAAKLLAADPAALVRCPERDDGVLLVLDERAAADATLMERYLTCDRCGARNVIRMRAPG